MIVYKKKISSKKGTAKNFTIVKHKEKKENNLLKSK